MEIVEPLIVVAAICLALVILWRRLYALVRKAVPRRGTSAAAGLCEDSPDVCGCGCCCGCSHLSAGHRPFVCGSGNRACCAHGATFKPMI